MSEPTINRAWRTNGVADQYAWSANVSYDGEADRTVTFVANTHGGPIVMMFVSADLRDRIGHELTEEWVRKFFAPEEIPA